MTSDSFQLEISMNSVCYLIENKAKLNPNSKIYIRWVQSYLKNIHNSLESMINEKEPSYYFTDYLKEFIESYGKSTEGFSKNDALDVKTKIVSLYNNLDILKRNTRFFYDTKESQETLKFFKDFLPKIKS